MIDSEHKEEQRRSDQHPYGNPYMQRASAVAVIALLSDDKRCFDFQNEAWYKGIRVIDKEGYLPSELTRGRRALTYHLRWIDYALRLRAARR
jgi:hypothetical protein